MDDIKEIKADVKDIKKEIRAISDTLSKNTASLIIHESRTTASEKRIESMEKLTIGFLLSAILGIALRLFFK